MKHLLVLLLLSFIGAADFAGADDFEALKDSTDSRTVFDRLHPQNNPHRENFADLNAIGVLAPVDYGAQKVFGFGSGTLIDACHVLTVQHVPYAWHGDFDAPPPLGQTVEFLLGQTEPSERNQTEGLKFVRFGTVTAYGGSGEHGGRSDAPQKDWAVVTLTENVPEIAPIELLAMDPADPSGKNWIHDHQDEISTAGFPGDHMGGAALTSHAHLWGAFGHVLGVYNDPVSGFAYFTATTPGTPGSSGGLAFTKINERYVAVGIIQSRLGDGIHNLTQEPTIAVLITPTLLGAIRQAQAQTPCPTR
jgi:hypothetical protein